MSKNTITEKELKEVEEQKRQFIEETDHYEEEAYQKDKGLIHYSQVALYKYSKVLEFGMKKLKRADLDKLCILLGEMNTAVFEEYERLNYLYYNLGKSKNSSDNNA